MNLQRGASHTITKFGVVGFSSLIVSSPDPTLSFLAGRRAWGGHETTEIKYTLFEVFTSLYGAFQ